MILNETLKWDGDNKTNYITLCFKSLIYKIRITVTNKVTNKIEFLLNYTYY
jgi:hypothetical protein